MRDTDSQPPKKRPGGVCKTSHRTLKLLQCQVDFEPLITASELKKNPTLLQNMSVRTIQWQLHNDLSFLYHTPRREPIITDQQRKNQKIFCKKYLAWDPEKWKKVLWSDEAIFTVTSNRGGKVRYRCSTDPLPAEVYGGDSQALCHGLGCFWVPCHRQVNGVTQKCHSESGDTWSSLLTILRTVSTCVRVRYSSMMVHWLTGPS